MVPLSELAAMTRKAADAEAAGWRMRQELDNTADENAKAAQEIEDLKARKVKLPPSFTVTNFCQPCLGEYDVHSAIRAAGVEVSS